MIPTVYGFFGDGRPSPFLYIGIAFLLVSLLFINIKKKGDKRINIKWGVYAFHAFAGNGLCSTFQMMQQDKFSGGYKSEFMILAYLFSAIMMFAVALIKEKKQITKEIRVGWYLWLICGVANGIVNLFVMMLKTNNIPEFIMFPLISAGGIIATFLVSLFIYKEKMTLFQNIGLALGIVSVVFLNI
jgi:drug/metabolite transporter (DMT)-like permease